MQPPGDREPSPVHLPGSPGSPAPLPAGLPAPSTFPWLQNLPSNHRLMICRLLQLVSSGIVCFDVSQEAQQCPKGQVHPQAAPRGRLHCAGLLLEASFPGERREQGAVISPYLLHVTIVIISFQNVLLTFRLHHVGAFPFYCSHLGTQLGRVFLFEEGHRPGQGLP